MPPESYGEQLEEQCLLVAEMPVDRSLGKASLCGDSVQGRPLITQADEHALRRIEQLSVCIFFGFGPAQAWPCGGRVVHRALVKRKLPYSSVWIAIPKM